MYGIHWRPGSAHLFAGQARGFTAGIESFDKFAKLFATRGFVFGAVEVAALSSASEVRIGLLDGRVFWIRRGAEIVETAKPAE